MFSNPCLQTFFLETAHVLITMSPFYLNKPETLAGTVPYMGMSTVQCMSIYLHFFNYMYYADLLIY